MEQQGLQFSQLPYYKAAERLEADNKHLLRDKEAFKKVLLRRQVLLHHALAFCIMMCACPALRLHILLLCYAKMHNPPC